MADQTHINIYDGWILLGVVSGEPRDAWSTARQTVNALANDAGPGRLGIFQRKWSRLPGVNSYQRSGFRAVNTFPVVRS